MIDLKDKVQNREPKFEKAELLLASQSPRYSSGELFAESSEIHIMHNGATYTLRITRSGGLLLNK